MNKITYDRFLDKVHGCWYRKCLGGTVGAAVEGIKNIIDVGGDLPKYSILTSRTTTLICSFCGLMSLSVRVRR